MKIKIWKPEDVLDFGKNAGHSLSEIYKYQPNYIVWLILNKEDFAIDIDAFKSLPKPIPLEIGAVDGSEEKKKMKGVLALIKADNTNRYMNVSDIIDLYNKHPDLKKAIKFKFSEDIVEHNQLKNNIKDSSESNEYPEA